MAKHDLNKMFDGLPPKAGTGVAMLYSPERREEGKVHQQITRGLNRWEVSPMQLFQFVKTFGGE